MSNYTVKNVDEFIESALPESRAHLREIRKIVLNALPAGTEERISYGKPFYKYHGYVAGFDTYKQHIGFEIWADKLPEQEREVLEKAGYKTGSRTFQIRYDQPVPADIIQKLVQDRVRLNEENKR